jgi:CheY-like chemotaxis protein
MPEVDGWTTARGLRARLGPNPYFVALTAQSSADDPVRLRSAGFDGFAAKPIKMAVLQTLLSRASVEKPLSTRRHGVTFDQQRWSEMAAITTASGATLLQVMCTRVMTALPDVATRIETAHAQQDSLKLTRTIHEAHGLLALIGATDAQVLASECEGQSERGTVESGVIRSLLQNIDAVLTELRAQESA